MIQESSASSNFSKMLLNVENAIAIRDDGLFLNARCKGDKMIKLKMTEAEFDTKIRPYPAPKGLEELNKLLIAAGFDVDRKWTTVVEFKTGDYIFQQDEVAKKPVEKPKKARRFGKKK